MQKSTLALTKPKMANCLFWLSCLITLLFAGCDVEDEPIPAYMEIKSFQLNATNTAIHGSVSEKITNGKIFLIDKITSKSHSLGVISLPATIPVLLEGEFEVNIDPVIRANGNSLYLQIYPFYNRFTTSVTLSPNADVSIQPVTSYKEEAKFEFIEDFEGNGHLFEDDRDENPLTFIINSNEDVFEGNFSGLVTLDTPNVVFVAATNTKYNLTFSTGGKFFMEVNYKTDIPLEFGILAVDQSGQEIPNFEFVVLPKDEWNKIYFDLTDLLAVSSQNQFIIIMRGGIPFLDGKFSLNSAKVHLDNIKLVHF